MKLTSLLRCSSKPIVMGILNVTPDSFSDGGMYFELDKACEHAFEMIADGADIIDIGGQSTRPGSEDIPEEEEINRVIPVIKEIRRMTDHPISIDTTKSRVASLAIDEGANLINDISALKFDSAMVSLAARQNCPVCLMHMLGTPKTMQENIHYHSVVEDIITFLRERIAFAESNGIHPENIIIDPGIGFGKTVEHNLEIIKNLRKFKELNKPLLIGASRKSFIGYVLGGADVADRLEGSLAVVAEAARQGVDIIRVHDVKSTVRFLKMYNALAV